MILQRLLLSLMVSTKLLVSTETSDNCKVEKTLNMCYEDVGGRKCFIRSSNEKRYSIFHMNLLLTDTIVITCGITAAVTLPLSIPEEQASCAFCDNKYLQITRLNGVVLPEAAFHEVPSITNLNLNNVGIEYIAPGALLDQTKCKEIYLSGNNLTEIHFEVFEGMKKLELLDLSLNKINTLYVHNSSKTPLRTLNVSHNEILRFENNPFGNNSPNLSTIDLSYNKIADFNFSCFGNISNLNVSHNNISKLSGCIYKIFHLTVSYNNIMSIENTCLDKNYEINYLDVSHNKISSLDFQSFPENLPITTLKIDFNLIKHVSVGTFSHLEKLQHLNLSHNSIQSLSHGSFEALSQLTVLDLSSNNLKHIDFNILHSMQTLNKLYLQNNYLKNFPYTKLTRIFPMLKFVNLDNNIFSCNYLMEMIFYLESKKVLVADGSTKYRTHLHGIACFEDKFTAKITQQPNDDVIAESVASKNVFHISLFLFAMMILILLLVLITYHTYFMYTRCKSTHREFVEMI